MIGGGDGGSGGRGEIDSLLENNCTSHQCGYFYQCLLTYPSGASSKEMPFLA